MDRRLVPGVRGSHVYAPTEEAWSVAVAVAPLAIWGAHRMGPRRPQNVFRAGSFALGMAVFADRDAATAVHETYEFNVEGERFHLRVDDGRRAFASCAARHPRRCSPRGA